MTINTDDSIIHSELSIEKNKTKLVLFFLFHHYVCVLIHYSSFCLITGIMTILLLTQCQKSQRQFYLGDFTEEDLMTSREKKTFLDVVQEHMKKTTTRK